MEKYIAAKPVRFDRDYDTNEEIPAAVINPKVIKRLVKMGKIAIVNAPDDIPPNDLLSGDPRQNIVFIETVLNIECDEALSLEERAEVCRTVIMQIRQAMEELKAAEAEQQNGDINNTEPETKQDAEQGVTDSAKKSEGLPDKACPVCQRVLGSQSALTTHIKKEHPDYTV